MKVLHKNVSPGAAFDVAGLSATVLRWVVGWTYFSAFWRRLIIANKLDPDGLGYVGEKFNHFLPNALFVKPMIEWMVSNPEFLSGFLVVFTIIEAVAGLFIMLGLFTRAMSVTVIGLAAGILFGAGWLGTTCLDEWQIGVLGIAAGAAVLFAGAGPFSLDAWLLKKRPALGDKKWFLLLGSGPLERRFSPPRLKAAMIATAAAVLFLTLFTNQAFHGGLWGKLHNLSVKPHVSLSELKAEGKELQFTVFRDEGADVYGSFTIAVRLRNSRGEAVQEYTAAELASLPQGSIHNHYIAKVKPGKHSLILPLGARADIHLPLDKALPAGEYTLELEDISGAVWQGRFTVQN